MDQFARWWAVLAAVFLMAFAINGQTLKRSVTKTEQMPFGAGGTVTIIGAPAGSMSIRPAEGNEVVINAKMELQAENESELALLSEMTGYMTEESLGRIVITAVGPHTKGIFRNVPKKLAAKLAALPYSLDLEVFVPKYCDLFLNGGKGDLRVEGVEGALTANFIESNSVIRIVGGAVNITVGKGSVDAALGIRGWRARAADISVSQGYIIARLPSNFSAELDAVILRSGSISSLIEKMTPRDRKVAPTQRLMQMKAGVGGPRVRFTVGDGNIQLLPLEM